MSGRAKDDGARPGAMKRERSGERINLAAQISLKRDATETL